MGECAGTDLHAALLLIDAWKFKVKQLKNEMPAGVK